MGSTMTKWLIDSKVEEIHKSMPWNDNSGEKQQDERSIFDDLSERASDMFSREDAPDEERRKTEAALRKSRKAASSVRDKYKLGSSEKHRTEEDLREEHRRTQEKLEKSRSVRDKMKAKYQRG